MNSEERKVRREFLKYIGSGVAGLAVGVGLGMYTAPSKVVEKKVPEYVCPFCGKKFATPEELKAHILKEHPLKPKPREVPSGPIKIGEIGYKTGPGAVYYGPIRNGVKLMVDEINAAGGVLGRKLKIIDEDEAGDVVEIAKRFAEVEKVDVIVGTAASDKALEVAKVAQEMGVIFLQIARTPLAVYDKAGKLRKFVFKTNNSAVTQYATPVRYLRDFWPELKRIAYIFQDYVWGHETRAYFDAARRTLMPETEVVADLLPKVFAPDYTPYITKLIEAKPELIVTSFWGGDSVRFITQGIARGLFKVSKLLGYVGEFVVSAGKTDLLPQLAGQIETNFNTAVMPGWEEWPGMIDFCKKYRKRFGIFVSAGTVDGAASILAYTQALVRAYEWLGEYPTVDDVIAALEGLTVVTPFGTRFIRKEDHRTLQLQAVFKMEPLPITPESWRAYIGKQISMYPGAMIEVPTWTKTMDDISKWIETWK